MLDDRKLKILAAVVDEYIRTGEPVGSKAIASLPDIRVSSATIRNDMAMLEQLGFLEQPHTSAGRIPTYSGYKLYIETLMPKKQLSDDEKEMLDEWGREFFAEGRRRIDLIRFGRFSSGTWWDKTPDKDNHTEIFPIPRTALETNHNLKQNPGY